MKTAFDKIAAGLNDAIGFAEGDTARARFATVDVRTVRARTKLSQAKFADTYRLPVGTVRDWEQRRRSPDSGSAVYLQMIEADPVAVRNLVSKIAAPARSPRPAPQ